ncbi:MAG: hypothetical protein IH609_11715 [Dehalococcoidia bacterium]|nr:hypothetical protein [Dehalococcoidia bacterium]
MTTKWEYAEFLFSMGMGKPREVRFSNGEATSKIRDGWAGRMAALQDLGSEGWEMVGYHNAEGGHFMYTFKRPLL